MYPTVTSTWSCNKVDHLFWFTILAQHETNDVILYIHSVHKHWGNTFQRKIQFAWPTFQKRSWTVMTIMSANRKNTNVWGIPSMETYLTSIMSHHSSWPFLECRPSKLYFKILWNYDDWSFRFHHFLENGRFYRENTCKCSSLVTKWQIILHFHCCFNDNIIFLSGLI
jgi:hypothetical protein